MLLNESHIGLYVKAKYLDIPVQGRLLDLRTYEFGPIPRQVALIEGQETWVNSYSTTWVIFKSDAEFLKEIEEL